MEKPTRLLPKTLKPATVDRMNAIDKGMRRKRPKMTHATCSKKPSKQSFRTYDDAEMYCARRYARTLSHLA